MRKISIPIILVVVLVIAVWGSRSNNVTVDAPSVTVDNVALETASPTAPLTVKPLPKEPDISVYTSGKRTLAKYHYDRFCTGINMSYSETTLSDAKAHNITPCDKCCTEDEKARILEAMSSTDQVLIADNYKRSETFHVSDCSYLVGRSTRILTRQQAIEKGLSPCDNCKP